MRHWLQTEWDVAAWSESTIEHAIRGSAEECVGQLRAHVATGVDRLILIPYRYEPEQVEILAREILPRLAMEMGGLERAPQPPALVARPAKPGRSSSPTAAPRSCDGRMLLVRRSARRSRLAIRRATLDIVR